MLKFLIIVFLVGFLFFKLLGLFFRVLVGRSAADRSGSRTYQSQQYQSGRSNEGNVNIDYVPNNGSKKSSKPFKGGEYVDYEEIK
ncbi:DUF4834 family protein [Fulvivirga sp. 29W222]|uniref:DUF4834 family protein n=1 Tax=Fulvivirga marina TaxID=2494733 RepID=A0A937G469_9BACT|nr:DUF4834 family protein [Fulvivirga marina]MBL6449670.1 DUF4834 family protein [Fulvivirga marina]